ncbi:multivesicular body subunit 12B-like isoform X2 [Haliotis cracherodii]
MANDLPIVSVCIVTDIAKCPGNHSVIEKTFNGAEEADLWKDGIFGRRVTRYLCVEKTVPAENQDVLVDVVIINEKDPVPPGFTVLDFTQDTREKALKKRLLCIRLMNQTLTNDAITELILMSKGTRKPPNGYTFVGELNHLSMCFKMGKVTKTEASHLSSQLPYPMPHTGGGAGTISLTPLGTSLPYEMNPGGQPAVNGHKQGTLTTQLSLTHINPLNGVPWQLNSRLKTNDITIPEIRYKSMMDVENEYQYDFRVERTAMQAAGGS